MKVTNRFGLPEPIISAVDRDYRPGADPRRFSATELIGAPRYVQLRRRHWDELEEDASDMLWMMLGTAVHKMLEEAAPDNTLVEEYFRTPMGDYVVSGVADLYEVVDGVAVLSDYKTTSTWGAVFGDYPREEWVQQLNIYAHLYRKAGFAVDKLQVVALYRDWSRGKARYDASYPNVAIEVHPVKLWSPKLAEKFITQRLELHGSHQDTPDAMLPPCTDEERWAKPGTYAVKKPGRKSAVRVLDTIQEAEAYKAKDPCYYIEHRPGKDTRCAEYCSVAEFCEHGRAVLAEEG